MIWDLHLHFSSFEGRTPEECMARAIEIGDRLGIDRFIVYLGVDRSYDPSPSDLRRANDEVIRAISHWHHRAFAFAYLNPNHLDFSLQELDRCVRDGPMVGVKLWVAKRCDAPELDTLVERATKYKAPIYQHTWFKTGGNLGGESTPQELAALARRHPGAKIICGHTGGDWEIGIRAVREVKSVSVDLAGSDPTAGFTEMAVRELGAERIIWGSDAGGRSLASQLGKVMGADISEAARRLILGENLKRLLMPHGQGYACRLVSAGALQCHLLFIMGTKDAHWRSRLRGSFARFFRGATARERSASRLKTCGSARF